MVRIKAMLKRVMFILAGSIILASCQNNMETQEAYLTFSEVASRAATQVNPNYTIYDFERFTLTGSNSNHDNLELGTWDNYDSLLQASVSIPELGYWDFTLKATKKGTVFSSIDSKNIDYGANSVFFELSPEEYGKEGNGSVRIGFKLQNIPYVKNGNNIQIDYDVTFKVVKILENLEFEAEKPATLVYGKPNTFSQLVDVFALWETESIPAGDYFVYFYVNKGDIKHIVKKVLSVTVSPDVLTTNEDKYNSGTSDEYFTITETAISDNMGVTECSITYNLNGGSFDSMQIIPDSYNILSSTDTVLPTPTKEGYNFGGWYTSPFYYYTEVTSIPAGSSQDYSLYAKWEIITYNITYELNGGTISESYATTYTVEDSITLPTPTKDGYEFYGWYTSQDFDYDTKISKINSGSTGDLTLYAEWGLNRHYINYELNGGTIDGEYERYFTVDSSDISLPTPTRTGYNFGGWYTTSTFDAGTGISFIPTGTSADVNVYANWKIVTYNITYELNGGTISESYATTYTIEDSITLPTPTRDGYDFIGWDENATIFAEIPTGSTGNRQFKAEWAEQVYSIAYITNEGTMPESYVTNFSGEVEVALPIPTRTGYSFDGWYTTSTFDAGTEISFIPTGTSADVYVYAKWNPPIPWTVSSTDTYYFEQNGDTWISNNQGQNNTFATTTWTVTLPESVNVSIPWSVSSESNYDKLTVTLDSNTVVNAVSGENAGSIETTLSAGTHTLTATYSKDSSQANGSDCATITLNEIVY